MGRLKDWLKRNLGSSGERTSQMISDIGRFEASSARDTAEREASVLKNLKDSVYNQDQKRIKSLIDLFDQLDSQQLEMVDRTNQIKQRISMHGVAKGNKKAVNGLVKKLEKSAKEFDDFVKKNRERIEQIKASVKSNDFQFAEMLINQAIESGQDLKKKVMEVEQLEKQINKKLVTPATP